MRVVLSFTSILHSVKGSFKVLVARTGSFFIPLSGRGAWNAPTSVLQKDVLAIIDGHSESP